eukprot:m.195651 g.195651  ORF g.195651 m.195651 type:complete len:161 (+) comp15235_c0_seq4:38-520(+)
MATLCAVSAVLCMSQLPGVLRPAASGSTQTAAVTALAERLLGQSASWIDFVVVPPDGPPPTSWGAMQAPWYEITDSGNVSAPVRIKGSSGVAVARGLHRYLTEYLNGSVTWGRPRATGIQVFRSYLFHGFLMNLRFHVTSIMLLVGPSAVVFCWLLKSSL